MEPKKGADWHYNAETKEGENLKFYVERIEDPKDPQLKEAHKLLTKTFSSQETESLADMRAGMEDKDEPYRIYATKNEKGEMAGLQTMATLNMRGEDGKPKEDEALLYGGYVVLPPEYRGQGHAQAIKSYGFLKADVEAEMQGRNLTGYMGEVVDAAEPYNNSMGMKRLYTQNEKGQYAEAPYMQTPLDWDSETGKPAKEAGAVPEHLMYLPNQSVSGLSGEKLTDMVRTIYAYNSWVEDDFDSKKAYLAHRAEVQKYLDQFAEATSGKNFQMLSAEERSKMIQEGAVFVENVAKQEEQKEEVQTKKE